MSEETNPNISLVNLPDLPESIDHVAKNLMDEPTKNYRAYICGFMVSCLWRDLACCR